MKFKTNLWEKYTGEKIKPVQEFCEGYRQFLSECKTERECIRYAIKHAEAAGFKNINDLMKNNTKLKQGDKVYCVNMDKAVLMFIIGKEPFTSGINIIGSHIDSPRLDLKGKPVFESNGLCLLDTHYYGGIKKYQWTAIPLALHGVVVKKDGSRVDLVIGEAEDDVVLGISDLLPHLEAREKEGKRDIKGEDLDILAGSIPYVSKEKEEKDLIKKNLLEILKKKGIEEDDFISAEIEVVPVGKAHNYGIDNSMIMGYGQDDRVCAYTSLKAILEVEDPEKSAMCLLVDKEEIGSIGATGMSSQYYENALVEIMNLAGQYSELNVRRTLNNSSMLSSDVTAALDPVNFSQQNPTHDAHFARGISLNKYVGSGGKSGSNDANPEFIARLRKLFDDEDVAYQATEMGKVDAGGGGTISYILAKYGMNVIDAGVPVLNMHAPWEISCKVDVYETYRAYKAFYKLK